MTKQESIGRLKKGHQRFKRAAKRLIDLEMTKNKILGDWTLKNILAHLSAWNWEQAKAIDVILAGQKPKWWGLNENKINEQAIKKREVYNLGEIINEWEESFKTLILRVSKLSNKEWLSEACEKRYEELKISINSMLSYKYRKEDHEGGHARQIAEFLKNVRTKEK